MELERTDVGGRVPWGALSVVVAAWALLRFLFGAGLSASDPLEYVELARRIADGSFTLEAHHYSTRFAVTAPVALLIRCFGVTEPAVLAWPLLCSLGTLLLLFVLGRRHGGACVGLLAAALWAVLPLDIAESTNLLPDPILAFFCTLAVVAYERGMGEFDVRRARPWLLLAGVAIWGAYSAKIAGALIAPLLAIHAATLGRRGLRLAWTATGTLFLLVPELAWYQHAAGDWLLPLHGIAEVHEKSVGVAAANKDLAYRLLKEYANETLRPNEHFGLLGAPLLLAAAATVRDFGRLRLLFLWGGGLFAYFNFGSSSLDRFVAIPANTRYLHPVVVPGLLLAALAIVRMVDATRTWRYGRALRVLVATGALALLGSTVASAYVHSGRSYVHLTFREGVAAAASLRARPAAVVCSDPRTAQVLRFAFGPTPPFALLPLKTVGASELPATLAPGVTALVNWREVCKLGDNRMLERDLRESWLAWVARTEDPERTRLERIQEPTASAHRRLAKLPWIWPAVRRDDRVEYFQAKARPHGIWRVEAAAVQSVVREGSVE